MVTIDRISRPFLLLPFFILLYVVSLGQDFKFHQLQSNQILDNQSILSIDQDKEGRLWFGGKDKLYVYDSRSVKNIFENDSLFINGEYLNKIAIDEQNNIFLGTAYSLLIYNATEQQYIAPKNHNLLNAQINDIKLWRGKAFVASSKGLFLISFDKKREKYAIEKQITDQRVQTIGFIDENTLMYSSKNQIFTKQLKGTAQTPKSKIMLPITDDFITAIYSYDKKIWIGTHNSGIFVYERNQLIKRINENNSLLLSNNIRKIAKINDTILIGTLKGLTVVDQRDHITNFTHEINVPWSISQNSIYDVYQDDQNIVWVGTYFGGINAIYPNSFPINTLTSKSTSKYRLQSEIISSIVEDSGKLYIGTEETGLQIIDKLSGSSKNSPISSNLVKSLLLTDNKLYIGQHIGGLSILDLRTNKLQNNRLSKQDIARANNVNEIIADVNGNIFLGTDNGIVQWDSEKEFFFEETKGFAINQILDNKMDGLFTIIRGKLWFKKYKDQKFEPIETKNIKKPIYSLSLDENGDLWISTDNQVFLLNAQNTILVYEDPEFKFGNILHLHNLLWICTNQGLLRYNLNTKQLHTFNIEDGLTANSLQSSKFYVSDNDQVYITSLKGINIFNPKEIKLNNRPPTVLFSKFSIFDKEARLATIDGKKDIPYHIHLSYDQNYFTIEFAASNFIKPQKNQYKYKLGGFDKDWKQTSYPVARYMNIDPGEYTLWMLASNNDGVWTENPLGIRIQIAPPLWKTWWAYLLYALIGLLLLHFVIKFIVERQLLINSEKEHEKKIRFFTQVSHEIRTPLTLITVPIEEIISSTQEMPSIQAKAKRLQKNANKLLGIVNELLDFKKIDDGKEKLLPRPVRIKPYLEEFFYLFSDLAIAKHLNFYIKDIEDIGTISLDTKQFDKALFNLLSNALKYSYEGGTVFLETQIIDNKYIIRIADNGIGISENNQFKIFEEYYRDPKAQDTIGTGIGLALTKKIVEQHKGEIECTTQFIDEQKFTFFTIKIPTKYFAKGDSTEYENNEEKRVIAFLSMNRLEKETLLLVEDNRELSETIANLFNDHYNVLTAYDGEEGLENALKYLPDVIVSDVMMPKMNGIDMCEKIKSNILTAHIPLILLTADTSESSHISGLKYGANVYLEKPFNTNVLLFTVKNLLEIASNKRKEFNIQSPSFHSEIDHKFLLRIEEIIDKNLLNNHFSVDFLSREIGMSPPILYKKIKAITNLSVNNFIKQYRFKKAVQLLKSEKSISEVAYAVGFSDRKYFSREFKKHFGVNPSDFSH